MTEGLFWKSFDEALIFLNQKELLKEDNIHRWNPYSEECTEYSRGTDYKVIYQKMADNRDYDILLFDDSMLQMSLTNGESRLLYIQNPLCFISFEDYLIENGIEYKSEWADWFHESFYEDYQQALEGMKLNSGAVYLRYDVDSRGRKDNENIHAYTHLHVGLNNSIRIPVGKHLTPYTFVMFVLRNVYYDKWVDLVRNGEISFGYKRHCTELPGDAWTEDEKKELYII